MTVYVEPLDHHGWVLHGRRVTSCHLFSDEPWDGPLLELHDFALFIGLKRSWFQPNPWVPHYDLVKSKREDAIAAGAKSISRREAVELWQKMRVKRG